MPAYIVKALNVTTISGNVIWFCVIKTVDGTEICRSVVNEDADRIATLLIASEAT